MLNSIQHPHDPDLASLLNLMRLDICWVIMGQKNPPGAID